MATDILYTIVYYFNYYFGPFEIFNSWLDNQKALSNYFTIFLLDWLFVICNVMNSTRFLTESFLFLFNFMVYSSLFVVFRTYMVSSLRSYKKEEIETDFETNSECSDEIQEKDTQTDTTFNSSDKNTVSYPSPFLEKEQKTPETAENSLKFKFTFGSPKKPDLNSIEEDFHVI